MSENNELKIKIPVLVDDSAAAKGRFQRSIRDLAKEMKGANAPKIQITVSKINGKEAIQTFKREIEAVIGSVSGGSKASKKTSNNSDAESLAAQKRATAELERYMDKARKLNDINGAGSKIANFDTTIEMYRKLGLNVDAAATDLKELHSAKRNFDAAMAKGDKGEIAAAYKALDLAIQKTGNSFSKVSRQRSTDTSINKEKASLHNLILEMQAYEKQNNKFRSNTKHALAFDDLNGKMQAALKAGDFSAIAEYTEKWKTLQGSIRSASLEGQTFGARLKQQFAKLGVYLSATAVIMQLRRAIKETINTVIELDGVVTDLQIATGGTRKETQELLNTYSKMGKELGATTVDVGKAADAWLRQGYNVAQTNELIKNSMMLSKLGQIDSAEATKALTSAMKGYGVSVNDTMSIVDKFTAIDMKAAISAGDIATAMAEVATSARLAGVDINKLSGYLAVVAETTQDAPESVGTFYRTLFARMGNVKAGNLVDPEDASSLSDVETTLSGLGIKLRDSKSEFRNFGEVLDEVAQKWKTYGTVNQNAIAVAFSGTRQQDKFRVLMEHYGTALDYATIATNSAGTALDKYENSYLKSAEAAQARFTAQFEQMSTAILKSDFLIGTINTGAGMLGALTQLTNLVGGLPLLASAASGAVSAILNKGLISTYTKQDANGNSGLGLTNIFASGRNNAAAMEAQIANDVKMMSIYEREVKQCGTSTQLFNRTMGKCSDAARAQAGALRDGTMTAQVWGEQQRRNNQALLQTSIATKAAAFGMKALSIAANMALTMGIGIAISFIVEQVMHLANAQQEAIDKANEMASAYKSASDDIKSNITTLESLDSEFEKLSRGVDNYGKNISLSAEEYSRYKEIVQQIVGISPSLITGYDNEGNAIANKNGLLEKSIALMKDEQRLRLEEYVSDESLLTLGKGKIEEYNNYQKEVGADPETGNYMDDSADMFSIALSNVLSSRGVEATDTDHALFKAFGFEDLGLEWNDFTPVTNAVDEYYDKMADSILHSEQEFYSVLTQDEIDQLQKLAEDHNKNVAVYAATIDQKSQALNPTLQLVPQTLTAYQTMSDAQKAFISDYINGFRITNNTTTQDFLNMRQSILNYTQAISDSQDAQDGINELFTLDKEKLSYGDWKSAANELINTIADALGLEGDERKDFFIKLGIKVGELDPQLKELDGKMKNVTAEELETLTEEEIRIGYTLENIENMTIEEFRDAIKAAQNDLKNMTQPEIPSAVLQSYDDAINKMKALQELLYSLQNERSSHLHAETIAKLNELLPESAGKITSVAEAQEYLNVAISDTQDIAEKAYANMLIYNNQWVENSINNSSSLSNALARCYDNDVTNWKKTANVKRIVDNALIQDLSAMWAKYSNMTVAQIQTVYDRLVDQSLMGVMGESDLQAMREMGVVLELYKETATSFESINFDYTPSSGSKKEVEEYKASIDALYEAEERLARIQNERTNLQQKFDLTDDLQAQIQYLGQMNQLYEDEQAQLHVINDLRDKIIAQNAKSLRAQGFVVEYDPQTNELFIQNMKHVNELIGKDTEATNALRKEYEELIKTTISLNKTNQEGSLQYLELAQSINEANKQIQAINHQMYTNSVNALENKISLLENQYDGLSGKSDNRNAIDNLKLQTVTLKTIQEEAAKEAARLRAQGIDENDEMVQACISTWWGAEKELDEINSKVVESILGSYDEFISRADDFNWWGDIDTTKVEWLEKKLQRINELFADGLLTEDQYKELVQESAKTIYDEKNQAIQDTIDLTMELIKQEKQNLIDHIEEEKKSYADIVAAKKEALALTKEEYGYQKTLTDKLTEIAKIQNKLNELVPDDSREAAAQKKQLAEELAKLQGDLDDTQADHTYQSQVDALDKSQDAFEKSKDNEIKVIEESINSTQKLYDLAIKRIDAGWDELYDSLMWYNDNYGDGINGKDSIVSAWEEAKNAAQEYGDVVSALDGIKTEHAPSTNGKDSVGSNPSNSTAVQNYVEQMRINSEMWKTDPSRQSAAAAENRDLAKKIEQLIGQSVVIDHGGVWHIGSEKGPLLYNTYHNGGVAGDSPSLKQSEVMAKLKKGEPVLDKQRENSLYKVMDFVDFFKAKLGASFAGNFDKPIFSTSSLGMLASLKLGATPNSSFNPTINVNLNGPVSKDVDPKKFGKIAGESALEVLKTALGGGSSGTTKSPIFSA